MFLLSNINAQTLVNQEWVTQYGLPDTIAWSASTTDASGNLYTTGNTFIIGNGTDLLLSKYDPDGNLLWQETYDHDGQNDYGVAIHLHPNGDLSIAAALYDSNDDFDIGLIHYDNNGNFEWMSSHDYEGQYDVPTALAEDINGNIYLSASSLGTTTDLDYLTLKFDEAGNELWAKNYDFVGGRDVPVSLVVENAEITVTGASEDSLGEWDFYTVMYDPDGNQLEEYRLDKPGVGFDEPAGIVRDASGNFYLTGRASDNGIDYYIQTVKLDPQLNLLWEVNYTHTGQDGATGLGLDSQGNIYICGYLAEPTGQDLFLIKYDPNGNLDWEQIEVADGGGAAAATSMHINWEDQIFITGYETINSEQRLSVMAFDEDGQKLWEQTVEDGQYVGGEIITNGASAYVSGRSYQNGNYQYVAFKYSFWDASSGLVLDSVGNPTHVKGEVIVSFAPEALHQSVFESTDIIFGNIDRFIKSPILDELEQEEGLSNIRDGYAYKVFKNLTLADSLSVTRLGDTIKVKYLWNTLVIRLPDPVSTVRSGSGSRESEAATSMENIYPYVWYAEPNAVYQSTIGANDNKYSNKQISLHGNSNNDINLEPAWDIETGKPHIRAGVFDSGIRWSHNDLCNINKDDFAESRVKGGWNYIDNIPIDNDKDNDDFDVSHGTHVAGIIGAIRNNNKGVAGIAGGNDDSDPGVSLYAMKLMNSIGDVILAPAISSIIDGVLSNPNRDIGEALHIGNHSWGGSWGDLDNQFLFTAINTAYIHQVTSVFSMGNDGDIAPSIPGRYTGVKDHHVISVGATGDDGNFVVAGENDGQSPFTSSYGPAVDIVAPGIRDLVFTIDEGPRGFAGGLIWQDDKSYHWFDGTSAAAPHVSGVAALMMSYKNDPNPSPQNLSPEDIEEMLQLYATPLPNSTINAPIPTSSSPNELTGHGRLDAGNVMTHLAPPFDLIHYEHSTPIGSFSLFQSNAIIDFSEGALSAFYTSTIPPISPLPFATIPLAEGTYIVDVFRYTATIPHNLSNTSILASWPRESSSNVVLSTTGTALTGDPGFILSNVSSTSATVEGYVYHFKFEQGGGPSINTWFPFNPNTQSGTFTWTLHTEQIPTSISPELNDDFNVEVFPNPNSGQAEVWVKSTTPSPIKIEVLNLAGALILESFHSLDLHSNNSFSIDLSSQAAGLYFLRVSNESKFSILKFIKQ